MRGDNTRIRELLQRGENPNERNLSGVSLFVSACFVAPKSVIELLLENGGDPSLSSPMNGQTPLMLVIRRFGDAQLVDAFLKKNVDVNAQSKDGWTALMDAVNLKANALPISKKLIAAGASVHTKNKDGSTVLFWAADADAVNFLVDSGVSVNDLNANGDSALLLATKYDRTDVLSVLIKRGANVNIGNRQGETPLLVALKSEGGSSVGDFANSKILLDAGSDAKSVDSNGSTTLMYAVDEIDIGNGRKEVRSLIINELIDKGVNVNAQRENGVSALMLAAGKGNVNAVKLLIKNGANPDQVDSDGATSLMWAASRFNVPVFREISAALLAAGADAGHKRKDGKTVLDLLDASSKLELRELIAKSNKSRSETACAKDIETTCHIAAGH
ncbi:ankyrin repeat domain-containing protein [Rhodoferax sp. U11-2br]|uniref:ankyrin repeat domain-containing protein n=1 Tax=Rhodoferax sp. U11-2br TaxID=2838878 RepID=UPI001BEC5191|nr:ankyrin repeat domain-containing protein [Rhodoferax sp. U11-2br]MBT3068766.1 ankyrin repeat domain-containing protein [Rhodoferax sp. U11-2br]